MKSAEKIAKDIVWSGCSRAELVGVIRTAQRDAAEWMREEVIKAIRSKAPSIDAEIFAEASIRAIKLPGDGE